MTSNTLLDEQNNMTNCIPIDVNNEGEKENEENHSFTVRLNDYVGAGMHLYSV